LEHLLTANKKIKSFKANPLTSNLLIHYVSSQKPQWVIALLLSILAKQGIEYAANDQVAPVISQRETSRLQRHSKVTDPSSIHPIKPTDQTWHTLPLEQLTKKLASDPETGLTLDEAHQRLLKYGPNSLVKPQIKSDFAILLEQFNSLPVGLLTLSALVSAATGGIMDAAVILGVVGINAVIGFYTERQANRTIESLTQVRVRSTQVLRGNIEYALPIQHLVPGDVIILKPGDYVAADARLLGGNHLSVDEASLTGESMPVNKEAERLCNLNTPLADRQNMVYMGTLVTGGSGIAMVVGTAKSTQLGKIQQLVATIKAQDTPLEHQLDEMGARLAILSGLVCAGIFSIGILRGQAWVQMLKSSVSLAVAAVPEGLPAVATTTLALGIREMRQHQVAVRDLKAVETLGSVQVFCLDKTGTLTLNHMSLVSIYCGGEHYAIDGRRFLNQERVIQPQEHDHLRWLLEIVALCSDVALNGNADALQLNGSSTENALVEAALAGDIDVRAQRRRYPRLETRYRAEDRPFMSTLHADKYSNKRYLLAVKGGTREVLARCDFYLTGEQILPLDDEVRGTIRQVNEQMAGRALRVMGVAYGWTKGSKPAQHRHLIWVGLVGMADPLRPGMRELIRRYHDAGIETIMITGDQSATAYAIGKQLGLSNGQPLRILDSASLDKLDPDLLAGLVKQTHIFSRVSPAHKLRIVQALQAGGRVVAMTGDGINDGPALKAAEIGVAMGRGGTDVARSVSDVVLEDDNLNTMSVAVRQGRNIYGNIRKTIHYLLSTNLTEIEVMLAGISMGLDQPLNPMQLLWINLISDIFPGLALSMESPEPGIMEQGPRDAREPIISYQDLGHMALESGIITAGTIGSFLYALNRYGTGAHTNTIVFNTLTVAQLLHAISCRSKKHGLFTPIKRSTNPYLNGALAGSLIAQLLITLTPQLRKLLGMTPLNGLDGLVIASGALIPLLVNEVIKEISVNRVKRVNFQHIQLPD
jgi:Ca2+-transporting ATPase